MQDDMLHYLAQETGDHSPCIPAGGQFSPMGLRYSVRLARVSSFHDPIGQFGALARLVSTFPGPSLLGTINTHVPVSARTEQPAYSHMASELLDLRLTEDPERSSLGTAHVVERIHSVIHQW